jgi:hypothetical protein
MHVNETDLSYTEQSYLHPPSSSHFVKERQYQTKAKQISSPSENCIYVYGFLFVFYLY